jgi:septum site-determining protein MinD
MLVGWLYLTRAITVASGKGGIGKTTLVANLGAALAEYGANVLVLDSNLTTPNLGLHLGIPLYPKTLHDVMKGRCRITDAVYRHPSGLRVIPAGIALNDLRGVDPRDLPNHLLGLVGFVDVMLLDAAAGLGREALASMEAADEMLVVMTPDWPSATDALKAIKLAEQVGARPTGVVVNRIHGKNYELTRSEIRSMLELPIVAEIPEDQNVHAAIAARQPVVKYKSNSPASREIRKLAAYVLGIDPPKSFFERMLGK